MSLISSLEIVKDLEIISEVVVHCQKKSRLLGFCLITSGQEGEGM